MTNFDKWKLYTSNLPSPDSYINFSFYFMMATAIGRKVWMGTELPTDSHALFPNIYVFLVGPPAAGKGLIIKPTSQMLKHYRIRIEGSEIRVIDTEDATIMTLGDDGKAKELYLFPTLPDSTTFEKLVQKMAESNRKVAFKRADNDRPGVYTHNSAYFSLEELSSLLKKHTEGISQFMLNAYDCSDYTREIKHGTPDLIKKPCLNILAGTTPTYMDEIFTGRILDDGLSSRTWFIFEFAPRFHAWRIAEQTEEQKQCKRDLLAHIKLLSNTFGRIEFTPEADEYLMNWWEEEHPVKKPNNSMRLASYYGRKNIHVKKLAMIMHLAESTELGEVISLETAIRAKEELDGIERKMHHALNFGRRNPLAAAGDTIIEFMIKLKRGVTKEELHEETWRDLRLPELTEVLNHLMEVKKIYMHGNQFVITKLAENGQYKEIPRKNKLGAPDPKDIKALPLSCPVCNGTKFFNGLCVNCNKEKDKFDGGEEPPLIPA